MKRITLLMTALTLAAAGCGGQTTAASTTTTTATSTTTTAPTTTTATSTTTTAPATTAAESLPPAGQLEPGTVTGGVLIVGETVRTFLVAVPPGYSSDTPAPLLFDLHGRSGTAAGQAMTSGITEVAWPQGYVVVYPQAAGEVATWGSFSGWPGMDDDLAFFDLMIDTLSADLAIDEGRIFVAGFSNGGAMAARLACERTDRFAGMASVAGSNEGWLDCEPSRPIPVMAIHGIADQVVPFEGAAGSLPAMPDWAAWWASANGCGRDPLPTRTLTGSMLFWPVCEDGAMVILMALDGVGHTWPQRAQAVDENGETVWIGASRVIVDFFSSL